MLTELTIHTEHCNNATNANTANNTHRANTASNAKSANTASPANTAPRSTFLPPSPCSSNVWLYGFLHISKTAISPSAYSWIHDVNNKMYMPQLCDVACGRRVVASKTWLLAHCISSSAKSICFKALKRHLCQKWWKCRTLILHEFTFNLGKYAFFHKTLQKHFMRQVPKVFALKH